MEESNVAYIYGLSLDGVDIRYVGQTRISIKHRFYAHSKAAYRGEKTPLYHWMRKHGIHNVVATLLEETSLESADEREIFWIAALRQETGRLLNLAGGGRNAGEVHSDTREKMRQNVAKYKNDPAWRAQISASVKATLDTPEHKARIKRQRKEMWDDEAFRERHRESMKRSAQTTYGTEKRSVATKKAWANRSEASRAAPAHQRWHVNRGVVNVECELCVGTKTSRSSDQSGTDIN